MTLLNTCSKNRIFKETFSSGIFLLLMCLYVSPIMASDQKFKPADILIKKSIGFKSGLSSSESVRDIELLIYAFQDAYGGYKYLPKSEIEMVETNLAKLVNNPPLKAEQLCRQLALVLAKVSDAHLSAKINGQYCATGDERGLRSEGKVGLNVAPKYPSMSNKPWKLTRVRYEGKTFPVLSITKFPSGADKSWEGFTEAIIDARKYSAIIIDLRGNGGGDDTKGYFLANLLYGEPVRFEPEMHIERQNASTFALRLNYFGLKKSGFESKNSKVPDWVDKWLKTFREKYDSALRGDLPSEKIDKWDAHTTAGGGFKLGRYSKPIYVLAGGSCGSSCESTLKAIRVHPNVKFIGENTAGFVHFGNLGKLILPSSGIEVGMGTKFVKFPNNELVEKIGFEPDIKVAPRSDALSHALRLIMRSKKNVK